MRSGESPGFEETPLHEAFGACCRKHCCSVLSRAAADESRRRDVHESRGASRRGDGKTERDRMTDIPDKVKSVETG